MNRIQYDKYVKKWRKPNTYLSNYRSRVIRGSKVFCQDMTTMKFTTNLAWRCSMFNVRIMSYTSEMEAHTIRASYGRSKVVKINIPYDIRTNRKPTSFRDDCTTNDAA